MVVAFLAFVFSAASIVSPGDGCPTAGAVEAELVRLGARSSLSDVGTAEVRVEGATLFVRLWDGAGNTLGERHVDAPAGCVDRAALSAVLIAAWTGQWRKTSLGGDPKPMVETPAKPRAASPWIMGAGAHAFILHDGDQRGSGAGISARVGRGWFFLQGLFEATSERERPIYTGKAGYAFLRGGLGLGAAARWGKWGWDGTVTPLVARLSLEGKQLPESRQATSVGFALDGRTSVSVAWFQPFLFLGLSIDLARQRLTLDDQPNRVDLSPLNLIFGLGISAKFEIPR